jgi:hypothetical protein
MDNNDKFSQSYVEPEIKDIPAHMCREKRRNEVWIHEESREIPHQDTSNWPTSKIDRYCFFIGLYNPDCRPTHNWDNFSKENCRKELAAILSQ